MSRDSLYSDPDLVAALSQHSEQAFAIIYDKYWDRLLGLAYKITKDKDAAEEIVQEVFVALWRRRDKVKIEALDNYLATAVKFSTFKYLQRYRRQQELQSEAMAYDAKQLDEEVIDAKFLKEYLDGIVEKLPDKCKVVFKMSREDLMTNKEISGELLITEKTVEAHITRALKILKINLRKVGLSLLLLFLF